MLTCVYGSSEYTQALSRTGSIFGNTFIVNNELILTDFKVSSENGFESIKCNYNDEALVSSKGLIVGPDYHQFVLESLNIKADFAIKECARITLITRKPFLAIESEKVATYVYPPNYCGNKNAIRLI